MDTYKYVLRYIDICVYIFIYIHICKDGSSEVLTWKSAIAEPSAWTPALGGTDVDFELQWVHGYRAHDCRNNVRYSCAGSIVYTAAAVGVVYSKSAGKQKFFQGGHASDIIGMCLCVLRRT
jgi:hypothetical protein